MCQVDLVICSSGKDYPILKHTLKLISKHTVYPDYNLWLVDNSEFVTAPDFVNGLKVDLPITIVPMRTGHENLIQERGGSFVHIELLNRMVKERVNAPLLLTMDSDCMPLKNGWMTELISMMDDETGCAGVLHPFKPPLMEDDTELFNMARRIRAIQCYRHTHVCCQIVRTKSLKDWDIDFNVKPPFALDTGLQIPWRARKAGLDVKGWKLSRYPIGDGSYPDVKNRRYCLVFGDTIYHHGTGGHVPKQSEYLDPYLSVRQRVLNDGPEFLLSEGVKYNLDNDSDKEYIESWEECYGI